LPAGATERWAVLLKEAQTKAEYQRVQCLWLRAALGLSAAEIAHALGWQVSSVRQLHSRYLRQGEAILQSKPHACRPHQNLMLAQEQELLASFFEQAPAGQVPTVASIRSAYEQKIGRTVHPSVVYRLLDRQGWRKIVPRPKHPKADESVREEFKKSCPNWSRSKSARRRW
jgi:transposase